MADKDGQDDRRPRLGPRPLSLHMALQGMTWYGSRNALPLLRNGWQPWSPSLAAAGKSLQAELAAADPQALEAAVDAEAAARMSRFLDGVAAYRAASSRRPPERAPAVWSDGTTRLLDYGGDGPPVLVVPSLVNRFYILDLAPGRSLLTHLADSGLRPFVVDWDAPGPAERGFGLDDYIATRLEGAADAVLAAAGRPPAVVGYCMGGLLALGLAARRPDAVSALALLATPWDFEGMPATKRRALAAAMPSLEAVLATFGALPVDLLQSLFAMLDPWMTVRKFRRFAGDGAAEGSADGGADLFVALEDWLNDGVPLVAGAARDTLSGWYGTNDPGRGVWTVGDTPVVPRDIPQPALVMVPERDHIVPPATAWPLAGALPGAEPVAVPAGHIGMVAGSRGRELVFDPLTDWLCRAMA